MNRRNEPTGKECADHGTSKKPRLIGYARVSTTEQNLDLQRRALQKAGCDQIFEDYGMSGTSKSRPSFNAALAYLEPGDVLVVWRLDRLARSLKTLIGVLEHCREKSVAFRSLCEHLDTSTAGGSLYSIFSVRWQNGSGK